MYICGMEWKKFNYWFEGLEETLARIDIKKSNLDELRPIPAYVLSKIKESLFIEWTYNSNSIEGNTLTLLETKMVLEDGMTIHGKSLREHFEALNHQEAIEHIEKLVSAKSMLSATDVMDIHSLVLQKIEKEYSGRYRTFGVRVQGANFLPPNALKVSQLMDELLDWLNNEDIELHPLIKATIYHHRFVWIHPFIDGNGRTVRLTFNLNLMRDGFAPVIILRNDRKKYYDALNKADLGDYSKLLLLVLQAAERSLDIYVSSLDNTLDTYLPISTIVSEATVPYGQEYISLLARKGKIDAFKEGKDWLTTKVAVEEYMARRKRKRILG
jgi:Fic family protein